MSGKEEMKEETPEKVYRRALKQAIAETTHIEHEREYLFDELETQQLDLVGVIQMQNRLPDLSEKLQCTEEMIEKLHHYCCQEYSKVVALGERFCVAPTINYIKWSTKKGISLSPPSSLANSELGDSPSQQLISPKALSFTPVASVSQQKQKPRGAEEEEEEEATASASANGTTATGTGDDGKGTETPQPTLLNTERLSHKRQEQRREQLKLESSEALRKIDEEKQRKERLFKLALRGPTKRPVSASPRLTSPPGPRKLLIDKAMEARSFRKSCVLEQENLEKRKKEEEEKRRKAKLKEYALKGPAIPPRPQRPRSASPKIGGKGSSSSVSAKSSSSPPSYLLTPSPNRFVPSTSNFKAYHTSSAERAQERAKFQEYIKQKEDIEAAMEREKEHLEEKEAERLEKELRKAMEFTAKKMPDFEKVCFVPKNLDRNKPKEVSIREHIRKREEAKVEKRKQKERLAKEQEKKDVLELRKAMQFKARKVPNFKQPFHPKNLNRDKKEG